MEFLLSDCRHSCDTVCRYARMERAIQRAAYAPSECDSHEYPDSIHVCLAYHHGGKSGLWHRIY